VPESGFAVLESGFVRATAEKLAKKMLALENAAPAARCQPDSAPVCVLAVHRRAGRDHHRRAAAHDARFGNDVRHGPGRDLPRCFAIARPARVPSSLTLRGSFAHRTALRLALAQDSHARRRL